MFNKFLSSLLVMTLTLPLSGVVRADDSPTRSGGYTKQGAPAESEADSAFTEKYGSTSYRDVDLSVHTKMSAGVRSLLVPGWGQAYNEEPRKAALFFGVTAILAGSAIVTYRDAQDSYDEYKAGGQKNASSYDDYKNGLNLSAVLIGLTAIMWGVGVSDAVRNSSGPRANAGTTLAFNENGTPELVYERRF